MTCLVSTNSLNTLKWYFLPSFLLCLLIFEVNFFVFLTSSIRRRTFFSMSIAEWEVSSVTTRMIPSAWRASLMDGEIKGILYNIFSRRSFSRSAGISMSGILAGDFFFLRQYLFKMIGKQNHIPAGIRVLP